VLGELREEPWILSAGKCQIESGINRLAPAQLSLDAPPRHAQARIDSSYSLITRDDVRIGGRGASVVGQIEQ
jgi:hypothetical protein